METYCPFGNVRGPIMPIQILKSCELSQGAKLLYNAMIHFAGAKDHCWAAHSTLANFICCSVSSVKNYLNELKAAKLIYNEKTNFNVCKYYFLKPDWTVASLNQETASQPNSGYVRSNFGYAETKNTICQPNSGYNFNCNNLKQLNPPSPQTDSTNNQMAMEPPKTGKDAEQGITKNQSVGGGDSFSVNEEFEKFWVAYPRKEAKETARSVWNRLYRQGKIPCLSSLLAALEKFKVCGQWMKEHGRYIPQCVNWLKGCRWLDENLDAGASSTPKEDALAEQSRKRNDYFRAQEEKRKNTAKQETEKYRPEFEALISKFPKIENSGPAWGLWNLLLRAGKAPKVDDVPDNNSIGILEFLSNWRQCTVCV